MTFSTRVQLFALPLLILASVGVGACSEDQISLALEATVDAAAIAAPVIESQQGLDPEVSHQVANYLVMVSHAADDAAVILGGPGTPAEKSALVASAFAAAIAPQLPVGTPQAVLAVVQAVAGSVARFEERLRAVKAEVDASPRFAMAFTGGGGKVADVRLSKRVRDRIHKKAQKTIAWARSAKGS